MAFYLCIIERDALPKMDRVALVDDPGWRCLQEVQAAGWREAREQVNERGLVHVAGHGWFINRNSGLSM
ncbi:hypothetical protein ACLO87_09450 [Paenalcaligenes sp. Me52]|uniref:hypothetical protein n=1 Tax=Paenalcaligenes sp. Me52 TaxID=3392038 RepID=UPI003D28428A